MLSILTIVNVNLCYHPVGLSYLINYPAKLGQLPLIYLFENS